MIVLLVWVPLDFYHPPRCVNKKCINPPGKSKGVGYIHLVVHPLRILRAKPFARHLTQPNPFWGLKFVKVFFKGFYYSGKVNNCLGIDLGYFSNLLRPRV